MSHPFTLTVAPNGARRQKTDHPALPISPNEIARTAKTCFAAGADSIHLHVRDGQGRHSLDAGCYREAMDAVTAMAPQMAIQITTESAGIFDVEAQFRCLQTLAPAAASVSTREMARDIDHAKRLYSFAKEAGTKIQHILYSAADVDLLLYWMAQAIVPTRMRSVIFVLGRYSPATLAQPRDLAAFLQASRGHDFDWSVCAFGHTELACAKQAMQRGGSVRIGFENNIQLPDGSLARDNAQNVALARTAADALGLTQTYAIGA